KGQHSGLFFRIGNDGKDDDLLGRYSGRYPDAVVIAMRHDHRTDESCRYPPRSSVGIFKLSLLVCETDIGSFGKILSQIVGGTRLKRFAVLHHRFQGVSADGAWKTFSRRFLA